MYLTEKITKIQVNKQKKKRKKYVFMNDNSLNRKLRAKCTQQLPTLLGPEVHGGKDKTNKTL